MSPWVNGWPDVGGTWRTHRTHPACPLAPRDAQQPFLTPARGPPHSAASLVRGRRAGPSRAVGRNRRTELEDRLTTDIPVAVADRPAAAMASVPAVRLESLTKAFEGAVGRRVAA